MNQIVIRILWPQDQQVVAQWRCEYVSISLPGGADGRQTLGIVEAFQQAGAAQLEQGVDVTVLLPGELAIMNCVQLPARNQRQALQALPFVVEEGLADDIEKVHLAVGGRRQDGHWPVMVVDLAIMASIMDLAEQTSLRMKAMYVDSQLLPANEGDVSILIVDDRVLFHSQQAMAVFECASAASMIHLLLGDAAVQNVYIRFQSAIEAQALLAQQLSTEFAALGDTNVSMQALDGEQALATLVLPPHASAINLLQGRFTVRQPTGKMPWWQLVAAVFLLAWSGQLLLQTGSGAYFNFQAKKLERAAEVQYRKLFPDAKQVANPRKRLESRLLEGANAGTENSFAKLFSGSVQALKSLPNHEGLTIEQVRYDGEQGQLELELKASSIDQLDQLKQALGKLGLSSKISSANDTEGGITGRMQIGKGV
jgi:general secretion pathway protein L